MPRRSIFANSDSIDREKLGECKAFGSFFILFNEIFHLSDLPKAHKKDVPESGTSENLFYALFHAVGMWDFLFIIIVVIRKPLVFIRLHFFPYLANSLRKFVSLVIIQRI